MGRLERKCHYMVTKGCPCEVPTVTDQHQGPDGSERLYKRTGSLWIHRSGKVILMMEKYKKENKVYIFRP